MRSFTSEAILFDDSVSAGSDTGGRGSGWPRSRRPYRTRALPGGGRDLGGPPGIEPWGTIPGRTAHSRRPGDAPSGRARRGESSGGRRQLQMAPIALRGRSALSDNPAVGPETERGGRWQGGKQAMRLVCSGLRPEGAGCREESTSRPVWTIRGRRGPKRPAPHPFSCRLRWRTDVCKA